MKVNVHKRTESHHEHNISTEELNPRYMSTTITFKISSEKLFYHADMLTLTMITC